ncbi:DUF6640 family protein [Kocuria sp.]|jgi:hypothetical protein|uniref:DUF6640 family protein n=1 Tax=Kocuria sp. TaxID=1871328 RepID=UPI002811F383|nr:DUF6640 family protein [Kocuria sp.]HST72865.1 DUF6640 family protein [Kocuria rosea]
MSAGRTILRLVAGATAAGGFAADWNRTHLFNPAWPPHARFHDAQTIALGALLGAGGLWALGRRGSDPGRDAALGALLPAAFWASMGAAFAFPGTQGLQGEFPGLVPRVRGVWIDERFAGAGMLALAALGYGLDRRARGTAPASGPAATP